MGRINTNANGATGSTRLAGKRLSFPDFQRSESISGEALSSVELPVLSSIADADSGEAVGRADVPTISVVHDSVTGEGEARGDVPESRIVHDATTGEGTARADIPETLVVADATSGRGLATADIPITRIVHDADTGEAIGTADITVNREVSDVNQSRADAEGSISNSISIAISQATDSDAVARADLCIVTYLAGLGGTVVFEEGGPGVEGAEVHIIRNNDDTKVATTTTDADGRWHVTLPGGKTTDPDPEVYSIEVWYREGAKRDKNTELYNAENRPFIDTADPSERDPYEDDNIEN
jgi:hypothetical protein